MRLHFIDYVLWWGEPALMSMIAIAMFRRRLNREFPYFFNYVVLQILTFVVEFPLRQGEGRQEGIGVVVAQLGPPLRQDRAEQTGGLIELETLTHDEYERRRAGYIREGKGTPPPGAEPKPL